MHLTREELLLGEQWLSNIGLPCKTASAVPGTTTLQRLRPSGSARWRSVASRKCVTSPSNDTLSFGGLYSSLQFMEIGVVLFGCVSSLAGGERF